MRLLVATFLSVNPSGQPEVLTLPMPGAETVPPARIRRPISTPDGEQFEVWERVRLTGDDAATY
jgi:hypothetical protein